MLTKISFKSLVKDQFKLKKKQKKNKKTQPHKNAALEKFGESDTYMT